MPGSFTFHYRDTPGHWDVIENGGRAFAIRGEAGDMFVRDERHPKHRRIDPTPRFRTATSAMAWCVDELVSETTD